MAVCADVAVGWQDAFGLGIMSDRSERRAILDKASLWPGTTRLRMWAKHSPVSPGHVNTTHGPVFVSVDGHAGTQAASVALLVPRGGLGHTSCPPDPVTRIALSAPPPTPRVVLAQPRLGGSVLTGCHTHA